MRQYKSLKRKHKKALKNYRKTSIGIEQKHPIFKNGSRNKRENQKRNNARDRNPRKEIRNHRYEHQQQNTRDERENYCCRRFHRKHGQNNQNKCEMQQDPNPNLPGNPGHNEKTRSVANMRK